MSQIRDYFAARDRHETAVNARRAAHQERARERFDLEADTASHGYDSTELQARHNQERAADRAADKQAEAAETQARERDVRQVGGHPRERRR